MNDNMTSGEDVTREILGNIPPWLTMVFYVLTALAAVLAAAGFVGRIRRYRRAAAPTDRDRPRSWSRAFRSGMAWLLFQEPLRRDRFAGTAHLLMTYGFFILFVGTCLVFLEHDTPLHFFYGWFYLLASCVVDAGGLAFLVGLGMFLWRRCRGRGTLLPNGWWVASLSWLLAAIGITGFLLEGARISQHFPEFERWSFVGYATATGLWAVGLGGDTAPTVHRLLWCLHAALCVAFFALLPWQFFGHMVYGLVSWSVRTERARSELRPALVASSPGVQQLSEFPWTDLLQTDACTTCGRCDSVCPANEAGRPLQPRSVVLNLRFALDHTPQPSLLESIAADTLWSCTTCTACNEACPVGIDVYGKIVEMRRGRVEAGIVPEAAEQLFDAVASQNNPWGRPDTSRMEWAQGLELPVAQPDEPVELLYWIGCAGSFDPDGQSVAAAMVRLLKHLQIRFHVLGRREGCTGDPARRLGEEGLYREQAEKVIATLRSHGATRILTHCPHCFNVFRNEYRHLLPASDRDRWQVIHHTEFLAELAAQGRLNASRQLTETVTFHDPCYLGRGNGVVAAPRQVLEKAVALPIVEMPRHGRESFCCGAGGGGFAVDVPGTERIENVRVREAQATGASTVVTGCPFCRVMLRTGAQASAAGGMRVRDLAEVVAEAEGV